MKPEYGQRESEERFEIGEDGGFRGLDTLLTLLIGPKSDDGAKYGHIEDAGEGTSVREEGLTLQEGDDGKEGDADKERVKAEFG